jgi:translocation and assembly module TamA
LVEKLTTKLIGPGRSNKCLVNIFEDFEPKPYHILNHAVYEKSKTQALSKAIHQGYLHAYFSEHQVLIDLEKNTAEIILTINSGPLFTFGPVNFHSTYFCKEFLNRFVPYKTGDFYEPEKVAELETGLSQSLYFKEVAVIPHIPQDSNENQNTVVPMSVNLVNNKANQYMFGLGYDTDISFHVKLGWDRLYLNQWGHRFSARAKLSDIDKTAQADYIIPGKHPLNDEYRIAFNYADDEFQDKPSVLYSLAISSTHRDKDWQRILMLRYLTESFKNADYRSESSHFLLPSVEFIKTKKDSELTHPKLDGYYLRFLLRGGINPLLSDKSFAQGIFEGKWLKQLTCKDLIITRAELGATIPKDLEKIPLSIRFFTGGDQTIRGYAYRSLPEEVGKDRCLLGGSYLAVGSIEYNRVIKGPFSLAAFVDGGNAYTKLDNFISDCQVGAGLGLRFATPVGPIKVDLAKPLTSHHNSWRIHINFGPEL